MSYREVYQSAPIAGKMDYGNDEQIDSLKALWCQRVPEAVCPSGVGVCLLAYISSSTNGTYFRSPVFIWDATDGSLCARYESGNNNSWATNVTNVHELPNTTFDNSLQVFGGNLVAQKDLSVLTYNPPTTTDEAEGKYTAVGSSLFPISGYWGGSDSITDDFAWDPINNKFLMANNSSNNQGEVRVYVADTGAYDNVAISVAGFVEQICLMNPPYAYAWSRNSFCTQFNYLNGRTMAVGKLPDFDTARGAGLGDRTWAYDRYNHRIIFADNTNADTDGQDTLVVRGFNPNPTAYALTPPMVSKEPRVGRKVKIWTRAVGNGGEGISQLPVTFSDEGVGDVAPQIVVTDKEGYAIAEYDGLATGGAETITVTATTREGTFPASSPQGSAAEGWVPNVHLSFNGVGVNANVSGINGYQVNWSQGTAGYGCYGDQAISRDVNTSSCELRVASGQTGQTGTGTHGTFGGDLKMGVGTVDAIPHASRLWVGVWVYFPTGFDFSTSTDGLRILQIRDNASTFSDPDDDIVFELRLKHGGGTTHTGYELSWPNETVTDTRHDFAAHSSVLTTADTWHWIQYYTLYNSVGAATEQRLWIDDLIIWELVDDAAQYRDSAGGGSLTSFTANEAIPTARTIWGRADEVRVFRNWEGGAPSDQTCYVSDVVWSRDTEERLPDDENGNRYISTAIADNL